jgi:uncharacterized protein DUF6049
VKGVFAVAWLCVALAVPSADAQQTEVKREVAAVVRISGIPLRADGRPDERAPRIAAHLRRDVERLASKDLADVPFAIAMTGQACDELRLSRLPDAKQVLMLARRLAGARPVLTTPYGEARIDASGPKKLRREITEGRRVIESCLGVHPIAVLAPPSAMVVPDDAGQHVLHRIGVKRVLSSYAVPPGADGPDVLPARTVGASSEIDTVLTDRPEAKGLVAVVDEPGPLEALRKDDRVKLVDLDGLGDLDVREGLIATDVVVSARSRRAAERATDALQRFRSITYTGNRAAEIYRVVLAAGEAAAQGGAGRAGSARMLEELAVAIERQFSLVTVAEGAVTFTSRRGSVPVTVTNKATYPVRIRVSVLSPKLAFPDGRTHVVKVDPPGDTITFQALARSSGTFPVIAVLKSPDGKLKIHDAELSVRSAAANLPALILTGGGALFLLVVFGRRIGRRRRSADA